MRVSVWVGMVLWVFLGAVQPAAVAQTPLAQPDLDLWSAGSVETMVHTADGGRIIGGTFTHVGGLPRRNLARLLPDGTVDPAWSADADGSVTALAVDAAGRIYVAGSFSHVAGLARQRLARLQPNGQSDSWEPAPLSFGSPGQVHALRVVGQQVYVAGRFDLIAGHARAGLARFSAESGALDGAWSPPASLVPITAMTSDSQYLYVNAGPNFTYRTLRYPLTGPAVFDPDWQPVAGSVSVMLADGKGSIYIAGNFFFVQGVSRRQLAKLSTGIGAALDKAWQPQVDGLIESLLLDGENLYLGGRLRNVGGLPRSNLARVAQDGIGAVDPSFAPVALGGIVLAMTGGPGMVHIGGEFTTVDGLTSPGLAALSTASGSPLEGLPAVEVASGSVYALLALPDGGLLVGGRFTRAGSFRRSNLLRLTAQGFPDPDWHADIDGQPIPFLQAPGEPGSFDFDPAVTALARDAGGRIYVGGAFSQAGSHPRANVARLLEGGQVDSEWNPGTDGLVDAIAIDHSGSVFLGGNFHLAAGEARGSLAKLSDGPGAVIDSSWQANLDASAWVVDLELASSGSLFAGGSGFSSVNGEVCCSNLVKLSASGTGSRDLHWNVRPNGYVTQLQLDGRGRLYVAGRFQVINQGSEQHVIDSLARVAATGDGTVDATWKPVAETSAFDGVSGLALGFDDRVYGSRFHPGPQDAVFAWSTSGSGAVIEGWQVSGDALAGTLLASGSGLYLGGGFSEVNGVVRRGLAAFATDGLFSNAFE